MQYKIERTNKTIPRLYRVMFGCIPMSPAMTKQQCEDWLDMQNNVGYNSMCSGYKSGGFINNALLQG